MILAYAKRDESYRLCKHKEFLTAELQFRPPILLLSVLNFSI